MESAKWPKITQPLRYNFFKGSVKLKLNEDQAKHSKVEEHKKPQETYQKNLTEKAAKTKNEVAPPKTTTSHNLKEKSVEYVSKSKPQSNKKPDLKTTQPSQKEHPVAKKPDANLKEGKNKPEESSMYVPKNPVSVSTAIKSQQEVA